MGRQLLIRWVSNVVALFVAAWLLSGVGYGDDGWTLILAGIVMLYVTDWLVTGFEISGFWWGAAAALIVSFVNAALNPLLPHEPRR